MTDVVGEGPGRAVELLEPRLDPETPHAFEPLHQLVQADVQARRSHRAAGGELGVADQEAEVALFVGDALSEDGRGVQVPVSRDRVSEVREALLAQSVGMRRV